MCNIIGCLDFRRKRRNVQRLGESRQFRENPAGFAREQFPLVFGSLSWPGTQVPYATFADAGARSPRDATSFTSGTNGACRADCEEARVASPFGGWIADPGVIVVRGLARVAAHL